LATSSTTTTPVESPRSKKRLPISFERYKCAAVTYAHAAGRRATAAELLLLLLLLLRTTTMTTTTIMMMMMTKMRMARVSCKGEGGKEGQGGAERGKEEWRGEDQGT
jgi:hypothetical protein